MKAIERYPSLRRVQEKFRSIRFYRYSVWIDGLQKRVKLFRLESANFVGEADDIHGCQMAAEKMLRLERESYGEIEG